VYSFGLDARRMAKDRGTGVDMGAAIIKAVSERQKANQLTDWTKEGTGV